MTQGDTYIENGIILSEALLDRISSEGLASPTVAYEYSKVGLVFSDYLEHPGSFEVEYTVSAPWMSDLKLTRQVLVDDMDECTYSGDVEKFRQTCSRTQRCRNTVGSFECIDKYSWPVLGATASD
eukprot:CAMPEP_0172590542 /NCGR_PEP_ID=MMETSP1068-20121228/9083_1 /TAXON_ID=35684 /ORGANISM="Pseudopedinella elastica, Strain CCMP716" /LENGTH=124 /DNA_ID=CAMNT_0013386477 /DNA_START=207 /DNA_END=581 /DNA_ORIENTATION=+